MPRDLQSKPTPRWLMSPGEADDAVDPKVFEDPTGRRRFVLSALGMILLAIVSTWVAEFSFRLYRLEPVSTIAAAVVSRPDDNTGGLSRPAQPVAPSLPLAGTRCATRSRDAEAPQVFAYLPALDQKARVGFRAHCNDVDALLYDALLIGADGRIGTYPHLLGNGALSDWLGVAAPSPAFQVAKPDPKLSTADFEAALLGMPGAAEIAGGFVASASAAGSTGVCLVLADHPEIFLGSLRRLMSDWSELAHAAGQQTCLVAGARAPFWTDPSVVESLDLAVLLAFEVASQPYSPSPREFLEDAVAPLARVLPPEKLVLAPGSFGLLWRSGEREPFMLSYADTMLWADAHNAEVAFSDEVGNSRIDFLDRQRRRNQIWLLDAVSFHDQMRALPDVNRLAVWPLGYEDPAVWKLLALGHGAPGGRAVLEAPVELGGQLARLGEGPLAIAANMARTGRREVATDSPGGAIRAVSYTTLPVPARLERFGAGALGELAITFNGLPDEADLPALLGSLSDAGASATFFVTATQLLERRASAEAVTRAGHGFGTTLLSLEEGWPLSGLARHLGLNRMQLQLSHLTGQRTVFVRESSGRLVDPSFTSDFELLGALLADGYIPVVQGLKVPQDGTDRAARTDVVRRAAIERAAHVLSIDLTGTRGRDVAAWLPDLIDDLSRDGFSFVGLAGLTGSSAPLAALSSQLQSVARDGVTFSVIWFLQSNLTLLFLAMLSLDASRSIIYVTLAFLRRRRGVLDPQFRPGVTVVVPAFNEEDVIDRCLGALSNSDYPHLRIIVVDDGSTDRTAEIVYRNWRHDPRITLLTEANQGKWHAANYALTTVKTPIFVVIDADTVVRRNAITWLVQQFRDPEVGAVAGFVEVGNRCNFLTRCQALEYIVSQAIGRRAFETLNGILVVPGAIGAWRTEAVRKAGRFSASTITEDADLTVAVHRAGYRVRFEEHARAFTEAPVSVSTLLRQRVRWALGMLQTSWKHRRAIREGRTVGFISIVDAIWISFLSSLAAPLVDLLLILLVIQASYVLATVGFAAIDVTTIVAVAGYFSLVIVDTLTASAAFWIERRRDFYLVALVPLLRFGYRQLMVFAALCALGRALTGRLYGWNKLVRTGTVSLPEGALVLHK